MLRGCCPIVAVMLLASAPAVAPALTLPYGAQITQIDDDDELRFRVDVDTLVGAVEPPYRDKVIARRTTGAQEILDSEWFALAEHPYVLRGTLVSETTLEPCVGEGLLECAEMEFMNPGWWDSHGTIALLDIDGWPVRLDGRGRHR